MDIELVSHAKDYIDDLANGKNPFTKEDVNENDIINNVKISRCLFYVSSVLDEIIANGGTAKKPKEKKAPFSPDALNLDNMEFSQYPICVSIIVEKINALRPENMNKLKTTAVTNWLVEIGLLNIITINGKKQKRPTAKGASIGITEEQRVGQYGVYYLTTYDEAAQHFIVDHLSAIIDNENGKKQDTKSNGTP